MLYCGADVYEGDDIICRVVGRSGTRVSKVFSLKRRQRESQDEERRMGGRRRTGEMHAQLLTPLEEGAALLCTP